MILLLLSLLLNTANAQTVTIGYGGAVSWKDPVANVGSLPTQGNGNGDTRVTLNDQSIYVWKEGTLSWIQAATPSAIPAILGLTGDVTASGPGVVPATIANNAVTNAKAAQMPANTIKGNNTGSLANAIDLTVSQIISMVGQWITTGSDLYYSLGNVMIGDASAPMSKLHVVETSTSTNRGIMSDQYNTGINGARITMRKARGTYTSPTTVVTGDALASWTADGYDGASFLESAKIVATSTGTISSGIIPATLALQTMDSAGTLTTGLMCNPDQTLQIPHYTTNGFVKTTGANGTISTSATVDASTELSNAVPLNKGGTNNTGSHIGNRMIITNALGTQIIDHTAQSAQKLMVTDNNGLPSTSASTGVVTVSSGQPVVQLPLSVANGGTSATSVSGNRFIISNVSSNAYTTSANFSLSDANNRVGFGGATLSGIHASFKPTSGDTGVQIQRANASTADFMYLKDTSSNPYLSVGYLGALGIGGSAVDAITYGLAIDHGAGSPNGEVSMQAANNIVGAAAFTSQKVTSNSGTLGMYVLSNTFTKAATQFPTDTTAPAIIETNGIDISFDTGLGVSAMKIGANSIASVNIGAALDTAAASGAQVKIQPQAGAAGAAIEFKSGGPIINSDIAQPTCSVSIRGMQWIIQGGTGVADIFQICSKTVLDTYAWVTH